MVETTFQPDKRQGNAIEDGIVCKDRDKMREESP